MTSFIKMLRDDRGAAAAEYALILAIVGAAIALAAVLLGQSIANAMNTARDCIDNPPTDVGAALLIRLRGRSSDRPRNFLCVTVGNSVE